MEGEERETVKDDDSNSKSSSSNNNKRSNLSTLSTWSFFDPSLPWVLVPNGSLHGYFDFVPVEYRVGPWSLTALVYLTTLFYLTAMAGCYLLLTSPSSAAATDTFTLQMIEDHLIPEKRIKERIEHEYPSVYSNEWWYNSITFLWMTFVMILIVRGPMGIRVWSTYTVQSWTMLTMRHGLSSLFSIILLLPQDTDGSNKNQTNNDISSILVSMRQTILLAIELLRFPVACSTTITFVVWNFGLMPFLYFHLSHERRQGFIKFCFSFKLLQIHGFNIVFCLLNGLWSSPRRPLNAVDFYLALLYVVVYMVWYLLFLDRIGVHLYPIFSPRTKWVVLTWTMLLVVYFSTFWAWRCALWEEPVTNPPMSARERHQWLLFPTTIPFGKKSGACILRGRTAAALTYWAPMSWIDASCEGLDSLHDWASATLSMADV